MTTRTAKTQTLVVVEEVAARTLALARIENLSSISPPAWKVEGTNTNNNESGSYDCCCVVLISHRVDRRHIRRCVREEEKRWKTGNNMHDLDWIGPSWFGSNWKAFHQSFTMFDRIANAVWSSFYSRQSKNKQENGEEEDGKEEVDAEKKSCQPHNTPKKKMKKKNGFVDDDVGDDGWWIRARCWCRSFSFLFCGPAVRLFPAGYGRKDQDWTNGLDAASEKG